MSLLERCPEQPGRQYDGARRHPDGAPRRTVTRRLPILAALLGALTLFGAGATQALAKAKPTSNPVIMDCLQHPGGLTGHYTVAQLDHALRVMPAETKEYTDCPDVINRARLAALGKLPGGGTGGSGSFLPTPVLIILIVLVLLAVTLGAIAMRRRAATSGPAGPGGRGDDGGPEGPTQIQGPEDPPPGPGSGPGAPPAA
jgi:hypothetical protein